MRTGLLGEAMINSKSCPDYVRPSVTRCQSEIVKVLQEERYKQAIRIGKPSGTGKWTMTWKRLFRVSGTKVGACLWHDELA